MASFSGSGSGTSGAGSYRLTLNVWESNVSGSYDNYSDVSWNLQLTSTNYNFYDYNMPTYVYVDGEVYNASPKIGINRNSTITIASGSKRIWHNSDGNKSIYVNARMNNTGAYYLPGNISCEGTLELTKIPRYANFTQHYIQSKTMNSITVYWASDVARDHTQYSLNGGNWTDAGDTGTTSGSYTVNGLRPGATYTIRTRIKRTDSQLWTESGTLTVATYDMAKLSGINSITIGDNVTLKYSNPSGNKVEIGLYNVDGSSAIRGYKTVTGGSYAFNFTETEIDNIYSMCPNSLYVDLRFYIKTTQGNNVYTSNILTRFNVNQNTNKPSFTSFTFHEYQGGTNIQIADLLGETESVIKGKSTTELLIANATAKNKARIIKYRIANGNSSIEKEITSSSITGYETEIFSGAQTATFTVTAIDSRGLATSITKTGTLYDYKFPYIKNISYKRENGVGDKVFFDLEATYDTIQYPGGENPHTVSFRYKKKSDTNYSNWYDITDYTGIVANREKGTITNADTHNFIPFINPNIKVGDNLNGVKLQFNFPDKIDYKNNSAYGNIGYQNILYVDDTHYIKEIFDDTAGGIYQVIVVYPDANVSNNEHIVYAIIGDYEAWKNETELQLPNDFGTVTQIKDTTVAYKYIRGKKEYEENKYLPFTTGVEYDIEFKIEDLIMEWTRGNSLTSGIPATSKKKKSNGRYSVGINCFPEDNYAFKVLDNMKLDDTDMGKFVSRNDGPRTRGSYGTSTSEANSKIFSNVLAYEPDTNGYGILFFVMQGIKPTTTTKFIIKGYVENNGVGTDFEVSFYANSSSITNAKCKIEDTTWVKDIYACIGEEISIGFVHSYNASDGGSFDTWTKQLLFIESIYTAFGTINEDNVKNFIASETNDFSYAGITTKVNCTKEGILNIVSGKSMPTQEYIDGRQVFVKKLGFTFSSTVGAWENIGKLENYYRFVRCDGTMIYAANEHVPLPNFAPGGNKYIRVDSTNNNVYIAHTDAYANGKGAYVIIYYQV